MAGVHDLRLRNDSISSLWLWICLVRLTKLNVEMPLASAHAQIHFNL